MTKSTFLIGFYFVIFAIFPAQLFAKNVTDTISEIVPQICKSFCEPWVSAVGDCVTNANANYSASINTKDLASFQFLGDLTILSSCACSATAVQASELCLACASRNICIQPALNMQDYFMICQDPINNGWEVFKRYHKDIDSCEANSTENQSPSDVESTDPVSETDTLSTDTLSDISSDISTPSSTETPCYTTHTTYMAARRPPRTYIN